MSPLLFHASYYLIDYEYHGHSETGLDLISILPKPERATLVTGHADDKAIQERCANAKIQLLSKTMLPFVPISGGKAT